MKFLNQNIEFPDVSTATEDGLLAVGGDLSSERLIYAYQNGIFPWYDDNQPILWWSPNPRFVLFPEDLKISKSMRQVLRSNKFKVTINKDFEAVIEACAKTNRKGQFGTWITDEMKLAYTRLHLLGYAKSVEVWQDSLLVGGLYGVDLGNKLFCGESMFTKVSNASKVGLISLIKNNDYRLIDCQVHTSHLERLGAKFIERSDYLSYLVS